MIWNFPRALTAIVCNSWLVSFEKVSSLGFCIEQRTDRQSCTRHVDNVGRAEAVVVSDYVVESNCAISDVRCSKTERDKVVCRISVSWMPKETFKLYKISGFLSWVESLRKTHLLFASHAGVSVREDGEGRDPWTGREASQGNPSKASNKQRLVRRCVMELYWNVFPKNDWELNANGWLA